MTESVWSSVDDYVNFCEGTHAIKKILIANNGIGATKAIKSLRRWSYETFGDERMVIFEGYYKILLRQHLQPLFSF